MKNYNVGMKLVNKKNGKNGCSIIAINGNAITTVDENGKETVRTLTTISKYFKVVTDPAPVTVNTNTVVADTPKEAIVEETTTAETPVNHVTHKFREKSLEATEVQLALLDNIPEDWEVKIWSCNKNMITCYYKNVQAIEIMSNKLRRVSTRIEFKTDNMVNRNSGYGLDATITCDSDSQQMDIIVTLAKSIVEAVDIKQKEKEQVKNKKKEKKSTTEANTENK